MSRPVAVVTGAGSGIGRAVPVATLAVATDVAVAAPVDALIDAVLERFGRIDLLFNNAGSFGRPAPFEADGTTAAEATMDAANVARAVLYMAALPLDANVLSMTVMATAMPFVGRG